MLCKEQVRLAVVLLTLIVPTLGGCETAQPGDVLADEERDTEAAGFGAVQDGGGPTATLKSKSKPKPKPKPTPTPVPAPPAPPPPPVCEAQGSVLFVVNKPHDLEPGDVAARQRLQALGLGVVMRNDDAVVVDDADGMDLIVISSSVLSTDVGPIFRSTPVPLVTWEMALYDDLAMTVDSDSQGSTRDQDTLLVSGSGPLSAGLQDKVRVRYTEGQVRWGTPTAAAVVAATVQGSPSKAAHFGYEQGVTLADGRPAPARRVGTFFDAVTGDDFTPAGWSMFDSAVVWALGAARPAPVAMLVTGEQHPLKAGDALFADRLAQLGYAVQTVRQGELAEVSLAGLSLVLISESVDSGKVGFRFTETTVPVVVGEPQLLDEMGMASNNSRLKNQLRIDVKDPYSPLAAHNYGLTEVYDSPMYVGWGEPGVNAHVAATVAGKNSRAALFSYDAGDVMPGLVAPGRRVGLFVYEADALSHAGWSMFDATIQWAAAGQPRGVPSLCDACAQYDLTCDGVDDDCDGEFDEDFVDVQITCGFGSCLARGERVCLDGQVVELCVPGPAEQDDSTCDGLDNDCDGEVDEDYVPTATECGSGACAGSGEMVCRYGELFDTCQEGTPIGADDATCDGVDDDCDGEVDEDARASTVTCGFGVCNRDGDRLCVNGSWQDFCVPGMPPTDVDLICDGVDEDCDGSVDEDYIDRPSSCGRGVCEAAGTVFCRSGQEFDSCRPGDRLAVNDVTCDGVDDDCDGVADEDFQPVETDCGAGVCAAKGELTCVNGDLQNSCTPGPRLAEYDTTCDAVDDDCDGAVDDDYISRSSSCGVGVCEASGTISCRSGQEFDSCRPGDRLAPNDLTCDGVDDDCDGAADEDFEPVETDCGAGVCAAKGQLTCVNGDLQNSCAPGPRLSDDDTTCDGVDDDCDGAADEDFSEEFTTCGRGACSATGRLTCVDGRRNNSCMPRAPGPDDASCDGVDNDCDGEVDEDYVATATSCGYGVCAANGMLTCQQGQEYDSCRQGPPLAETDITCDGVDDDCDGALDDDFHPVETECGAGVCASTGLLTCDAGTIQNSCVPGQPTAPTDLICDGLDEDCDGQVDEDFKQEFTTCGEGACSATGRLTCNSGQPYDSCMPGTPAPDDSLCDGVDNDCDGEVDEDFQQQLSTCGEGACSATGRVTCIDGRRRDSCTPGSPDPDDALCDGVDNDCDGDVDEDYVASPTSCGKGVCASTGTRTCEAGVERDSCRQEPPLAPTDITCDGVDDDCDGAPDDDFQPVPTTCGKGVCAANGELTCNAGTIQNDCAPGQPPAVVDTTCDGQDNDCDGSVDEDYSSEVITCGVGACRASTLSQCLDGREVRECTPGTPEPHEACDGIDNDCDGVADEEDGTLRWSLADVDGPAPRWGAAMAYDEHHQELVLFGGTVPGSGSASETWLWDGTGWTMATGDGPAERIDHALAYDSARGRVVLFGGLVSNVPDGETWEWDGAQWQLRAVDGPQPRFGHAMAFDQDRGRTVLFGGEDLSGYLGDTWEWDGNSWLLVGTAGPTARKNAAMWFDTAAGRVSLFGGFDDLVCDDLWEWDGASWWPMGQGEPVAREEHAAVYDAARSSAVLFGGIAAYLDVRDDAWLLQGGQWSQVPASGPLPSARLMHSMGYDPTLQSTIVHGGLTSEYETNGETWVFGELCFGRLR